MKDIKFSVIIPTRERVDTLVHALATCTTQDYDNLDIVVSDNFSQDNTREVVSSFSDPRIKYLNTGKRISMSHNWEFALNHITEGWVTFLGDDDGLLPGAINAVADVVEKTGCQAVVSRQCGYWWPESARQDTDWFRVAANCLIVPLGKGFQLRNGRDWLRKVMRQDAEHIDLPWLYTGGFADIRAVNRARGPTGEFFLSMIPDLYSSIALASVVDTYVILKEPVAVCGVSSHSAGNAWISVKKSDRKQAEVFFSENNIPFHSMLAGGEVLKSVQIAVYESYLQTAHLHHNFLKIKLEDQLALILAGTPKQDYSEISKYCYGVAQSNGVDRNILDRKTSSERKRLFLRRLNQTLGVVFGQLNLSDDKRVIIRDAREFGATNIYGATLLAKAVYLLETRYTNLPLDLLTSLIKAGFKR
ncbi:MAG: glycosyltransferase family 2 protein [Dehalococcoidia bacterium]|jgi:glycosyltransferase involved in cell wall biosynthesis